MSDKRWLKWDRRSWVYGLVLTLFTTLPLRAQESDFETPPVLEVKRVVPAELRQGERYRVLPAVANDGYMNAFRVESEFGLFEAYGEPMLAVRIQEIKALAELDELSKTEVFVDAVAQGAVNQVTAVKEFAERPVETVKGIPGGVKRMFKRVKWDVEEGVETVKETGKDDAGSEEGNGEDSGAGADEEVEEDREEASEAMVAGQKYAKKYFGVSRAERRWAEKLGVDPYTSNEVLIREIKKVAKIDAAGSFSVRLAPIPRIPGVSYVADVTRLVWSTDPRELRELNLKRLMEMGAEEELSERFLDTPWYSPTLQTYLVAALSELEGVEDRPVAIELAVAAESEEEALFFAQTINMLAGFHRSQTPIERLAGGARLPAVLTEDARLVVLLPVDDIFWTEGIAAAATGAFSEVGADLGFRTREIWFRGGASLRCRQELEKLGWRVFAEVRFAAGSS